MHRRTNIYLDDKAMKALKLLAAASGKHNVPASDLWEDGL
jgi:hypothetical protein